LKDLNNNDLYRLIVESSNEGVWVIDKNELTTFVNPKLAEMLGYDASEMIGKVLFDFMDEEGKEITLQNLSKRKKGVKENHEFLLQTKSGAKLWTEMKSSPLMINGLYVGALAFVSDITARKKAEEERKENLSQYYSLFEDSPIPIWDEDFSGVKEELDVLKLQGVSDPRSYFEVHSDELYRVVSRMIVNKINMAVVELNEGVSKEDVLNNFKRLLTKKSFEYALRQIEAIWNNETVCEFDAELKTLKGNKRYVHFKWTVVKGYEDNYKRVYLTTTDLSERIKEENLSLQRSNREKETLLKEVHHRVKNNLQIISSLLKLQSYTTDDPQISHIIEVSLSRISSMAKVHELLYRSTEFSRIDYEDYLDTLISSLISTMSEKEQKIDATIDVADIQFNIDTAIPLGLLINEILTNSMKHAFKGLEKGKIYVKIIQISENEYILFIGDNGIGYNHESSFNNDTLGMSLIQSLTEQISGSLQLLKEQKGTHYKIYFQTV
jgi:PAS domain S-box-containing protein